MGQHYRDLIVWQKAIALVTEIYRVTREFPKDELYGLTSQIRRAAVSIPSNVAEGQGRLTRGEFRQFLGQARGSYAELETQLIIANNLGLLQNTDELFNRLAEVGRLLNGLLSSLGTNN
jgi:four helix bundle protein